MTFLDCILLAAIVVNLAAFFFCAASYMRARRLLIEAEAERLAERIQQWGGG